MRSLRLAAASGCCWTASRPTSEHLSFPTARKPGHPWAALPARMLAQPGAATVWRSSGPGAAAKLPFPTLPARSLTAAAAHAPFVPIPFTRSPLPLVHLQSLSLGSFHPSVNGSLLGEAFVSGTSTNSYSTPTGQRPPNASQAGSASNSPQPVKPVACASLPKGDYQMFTISNGHFISAHHGQESRGGVGQQRVSMLPAAAR